MGTHSAIQELLAPKGRRPLQVEIPEDLLKGVVAAQRKFGSPTRAKVIRAALELGLAELMKMPVKAGGVK